MKILQLEYPITLSNDGKELLLIFMFLMLVLCVALIGYFMKKSAEEQKKSVDAQNESVKSLKEFTGEIKKSVDELVLAVNSLQEFNKIYLPKMNERLDKHGDFIKHIDTRLTKIETEHSLLSCKATPTAKRKTKKTTEK